MKQEEIKFLEGPQSRFKEAVFTLNVMLEFIKGFRILHFTGPCVTIFGSARFKSDHVYYALTERVSTEIAKMGFTIMTGGGPGLMEAANKGAKKAGGRSIGCNIILPHEQKHNAYLDKWVDLKFFFVRKTLLIKYSYAFVVMPGGFGTLDEYFEALTLIQTGKLHQFPIVIMCKEFHQQLLNHIDVMKQQGTISTLDSNYYLVTDSVDEAVEYIRIHSINKFGLKHTLLQPKPWFFER